MIRPRKTPVLAVFGRDRGFVLFLAGKEGLLFLFLFGAGDVEFIQLLLFHEARCALVGASFASLASGRGPNARSHRCPSSPQQGLRPCRGPQMMGAGYSSSSFLVQAILSSSSCFCSTKEGAPIIRSWAFLFMGKGMISRMESSPASSMTMRSTPGAMPA